MLGPEGCLAFIVGFLLDVVYTGYVKCVGLNQAWMAGVYSVAIGSMSLLGLTTVIEDHKLAIPYLLGLFLGSVCTIKWAARKPPKERVQSA
jgi:hypothetical protein